MENDESNIGEYINCYKEQPKGYYLDKSNSLYKKCYYSCETCEIEGNNITHNCLTCQDNFTIEINKNNYTNCYETCNYYYYFDSEYNFHCTNNLSCPDEYPSLNLSNFDTSKVDEIWDIFYGCNNLEYINLKNFNENSLTSYSDMFTNVPSNIVVCIDEKNTNILSKLPNINCSTIDCSDDWKLKQKKIISNNNCIDNCKNDTIYKYEYNGK